MQRLLIQELLLRGNGSVYCRETCLSEGESAIDRMGTVQSTGKAGHGRMCRRKAEVEVFARAAEVELLVNGKKLPVAK